MFKPGVGSVIKLCYRVVLPHAFKVPSKMRGRGGHRDKAAEVVEDQRIVSPTKLDQGRVKYLVQEQYHRASGLPRPAGGRVQTTTRWIGDVKWFI